MINSQIALGDRSFMAPLMDGDEERFKHGVSVRSDIAKCVPLSDGDEAERRGVMEFPFMAWSLCPTP
jgi:hypothetical protein